VPQVICGAKARVILEFTRGPARVVARQIVLGRTTQAGGDQQGIGEDIQHGLSPFRLSMMSFAMKRAMMRIRKTYKL
jgi:hypothetical protein